MWPSSNEFPAVCRPFADEDLTEVEASFASNRTDSARLAAGSTRPLRICLVTSSYNYIKDGIALTLNRLVGYLEDQGVDVRVFAPVAPVPALKHRGRLTPVPSMALPMRPEYRLAFGLPQSLQNEIEAFNPDIIHIAVPDLLGYGALKLGRRLNVPVVASYHTRYDLYTAYYLQLKTAAKAGRGLLALFLSRMQGSLCSFRLNERCAVGAGCRGQCRAVASRRRCRAISSRQALTGLAKPLRNRRAGMRDRLRRTAGA